VHTTQRGLTVNKPNRSKDSESEIVADITVEEADNNLMTENDNDEAIVADLIINRALDTSVEFSQTKNDEIQED